MSNSASSRQSRVSCRHAWQLAAALNACLASCATAQAEGEAWTAGAPVQAGRVLPGPARRNTSAPSIEASLEVAALRLAEAREAVSLDVAVVDFEPGDGRDCGFTTFLSDSLTSRLLQTDRFRSIIERRLLAQVLHEQNLQSGTFLVDPKSRARIGRILGSTAIVTGSFAATEDAVAISARLIDTSTGRVLKAVDVSAARSRRIASLLCEGGGAGNRALPRETAYPTASRDAGPQPEASNCGTLQPWVGYVDIEGPFNKLPRHAYIDMGFDYGQEVWTQIELDGRPLPLCGRKQSLEISGRAVDLAPPHSRVRVVVDNPETQMRLARQCWARNPVTDQFNRRGTGDFDTIAAGNYPGWAHSCSWGR